MSCRFNLVGVFLVAVFALASGCDLGVEEKMTIDNPESMPHEHGEGDELVWELKEKIADSDYEVWLGHHGLHFHGGDNIEPAVAITLSGKPVADAKVFNWLMDPDDLDKGLGEEVSTVYEPETDEEPAHYAQGELLIPAEATKCVIRFRIEIEGREDYVKDVSINVGH